MNLEQLIDNLITGKDPYVYEIRDFIDQMDIIHTHASIRLNASSGLIVIGEYPLIGGNQVDIKVSYFKTVKTIEMLEGTNIFAGVGLSLKTIYDQAYQEMYAAGLAATISILAGLFATIAMRTSENRRRELADSLEVIQHMAHHDALTGLPNRNYLIQQVDSFCMDKKYKDEKFSVIFIDLDKFKWINDNLGHGAGDLYLMQVSERLKSVLGVNDIVSRHGGDEFIIVAHIKEDKDTIAMCDRIMDVFKTPFDLDGTQFNGNASLGAAAYPMDGENFKALAHAADLAMYESKENGRGCYTIYKAGMGT